MKSEELIARAAKWLSSKEPVVFIISGQEEVHDLVLDMARYIAQLETTGSEHD